MNNLRIKYLSQFSTYFIFDGINKALPFIILPIIASYLSTSEFGLVTNFNSMVQIGTALIALNSYTKLSTEYFRCDDDRPTLYTNLTILNVLLTVLLFMIVICLNVLIYKAFKLSLNWQLLALIAALSLAISNLYTTLLQMQGKAFSYGITQFFQSLLMFILTIFFVVVVHGSWQGRNFGYVLSLFIMAIFIFVVQFKKGYINIQLKSKDKIKDYLYWGLPLLPHTLSYWIKFGADKIIITNYDGLSENGIYSLALTLGGIVAIITNSFFNTYTPYVFKKLAEYDKTYDEKVKKNIISRLMKNSYIFLLVYALLSVSLYYIMSLIINLFFHGDYLKAIPMLPYVLFSNFIMSIYTIYSGFLFFKNRTKVIGTITFSSAIAQVLLNFPLIKLYGTYGALYSSIVVALITSSIITIKSFKEYRIGFFNK